MFMIKMTREKFIEICDQKLKVIRTEYELNQVKMAYALGISKKTLVEIEKGRSSLGWTGSVALCMIFEDNKEISDALGGNIKEIINVLAFETEEPPVKRTKGNRFLWQTIKKTESYTIEQNVLSQHYRLLDREGNHLSSSLNIEDLEGEEKQ